jgi:hypothetical protein
MNKNKAERLWVDPTLSTIYGQEKVKHYLGTELFTIAKIEVWIMAHYPEDCEMLRSDFEMYFASMRTIFHVAFGNCSQTL